MHAEQTDSPAGYFELLSNNRNFRRLLIGQVISQAGDWFSTVAVYTMLLGMTGSGESIAFLLILKFLPFFFVGPFAGVVADRFNRKTIMIVTDLARGVLVLGFLLVDRPEHIWLAYALTCSQVVLSTFFDPAKTAAVPALVATRELISANGLSGVSWSVTLALGAAAGGIVTDMLGRDAAFVIDSVSFFASAAFLSQVRFPSLRPVPRLQSRAALTGFVDLIEGARYLKSNLRVVALLLVKTGWGLGGGVLLLLTVFGKNVFPIGRDGSTSIGLLYAARGIGALIGPIVARTLSSESSQAMRRAIGVAFFVSAVFYILFARSPALWLAALFVVGAHAGGSVQWVFSTTLLQLSVPDQFRGRVFALELGLLTLSMSLSTYLTGWGLDRGGLDERTIASLLAVAFVIPGLAWIAAQRWWRQAEAEANLR
jgi:MFS family permease